MGEPGWKNPLPCRRIFHFTLLPMRRSCLFPLLTLLPLLSSSLPLLNAQAPAETPAPKKEDAPKPPPPKAYADPEKTDADFPLQGEYVGEHDGKRYGVQVVALGDSQFQAVGYQGGLPGDGWDGDTSTISRTDGRREEGQTTVGFESSDGSIKASVDGSSIVVYNGDNEKIFELSRTTRQSPTEDAKPPAGALILFGGKDQNGFPNSRVTEDGLLMEGVTSAEKLGDFTLHLEFRLPYTPTGRGQKRGNSGVYLQHRYEVQLLDSFGLKGEDNECGGLYKIAKPKVNMCYPPLTWQTYDIDFTAAKYDGTGTKTANAKMTVKHNGVVIHDQVELPKVTGGSKLPEDATPGPIHLQNHGDPVRFRNIWAVKK
jgi:hypothetical protein